MARQASMGCHGDLSRRVVSALGSQRGHGSGSEVLGYLWHLGESRRAVGDDLDRQLPRATRPLLGECAPRRPVGHLGRSSGVGTASVALSAGASEFPHGAWITALPSDGASELPDGTRVTPSGSSGIGTFSAAGGPVTG